jgi:O-antigen ligase
LIILLLGVFFSRIDPRMKYLFDLERYRKFGVLGWASKLSFAERIIYWITAFRVFLLRPFFGVGLGGSGFFFARLTPEFGYSLPEVVRYLFSENVIPNAKNLWIRLLAETGIVGFSLFCAWLFSHWHTAQRIEKQGQHKETRTYGLVGKLFIIAILMEGFSMDSFGLPYIWIAAGLIITFLRISTLKPETENPKTAP